MRNLSSRPGALSRPLVETLEPRQLLSGAPVFAAPTDLSLGTATGSVRQVVAADFDGDGHNDLAAVLGQPAERQLRGNDNRILFYHALPDGTFASPTTLTVVGTVDSIAPGRFTATPAGLTDLALLGEYNDFATGYTLRILRFKPETGALRVVARERISIPPGQHSMVVGNVIGNVTDEIIVQLRSAVSAAAGAPVQVYIGVYGVAATGGDSDDRIVLKTVVKQGVFASTLYTSKLQLADIDGDDVQDVIFQPGADTRAWLRQRPGFAERRITLERPTGSSAVTSYADMDNDGLADRVMIHFRTTLELGQGNGTFAPAFELPAISVPGIPDYYGPVDVLPELTSVRDLDGDGRSDVFYFISIYFIHDDYYAQEFTTLATSGTPAGYTQGPVVNAEHFGPFDQSAATFGDVNNDGLPDLIQPGSSGFWRVRLNIS